SCGRAALTADAAGGLVNCRGVTRARHTSCDREGDNSESAGASRTTHAPAPSAESQGGHPVFHLFSLQRRRVRSVPPRPVRRGRRGWILPAALAALLALTAAASNLIPDASLPYAAAEPQMVQPVTANPQPQQLPLDEPVRMLAEARRVYAQVQDY